MILAMGPTPPLRPCLSLVDFDNVYIYIYIYGTIKMMKFDPHHSSIYLSFMLMIYLSIVFALALMLVMDLSIYDSKFV